VRARACAWILAAWVTTVWFTTAFAGPIPFGKGSADITARDQPIAGFLQDLLGSAGLRVVVSPGLTGAINGRFAGTVEQVYRQVARAFNLVEYYDGSVLYVGLPQELVTRALRAGGAAEATQLARQVQDLGMTDGLNRVRASGDGTLLISGMKRFVDQVEELSRVPRAMAQNPLAEGAAAPMGLRVFYLRYAWAQDVTMSTGGKPVVLPGVASTLRSLMGGTSRLPVTSGLARAPRKPREQREFGEPADRLEPTGQDATLGWPGAQSGQPSAPVLRAAAGLATDAEVGLAAGARPAAGLYAGAAPEAPAPRIEADGRLNAVLVRDTVERMPMYESLIHALDMEPLAVEIEATLIDVNTDKLRQLGIQWRYTQGRSSLLFGRGDASDLALTPGTSATEIVASGAGGFASAVLGNAGQFITRINALESQGAARVVSSPQVLTLSNVEALFDSSQTFYVRVAGREQVDLFNVSAGTTLRVTPHVFKEGGQTRIKMRVSIEDGSLSTRTVDTLPVVDRASINTQAMIFEGESLLVGGITRDSRTEAETRVPGLADLPWVGALFRNRQMQSERLERLFLITPRLAPARRPAPDNPVAQAAAASVPGLQVVDIRGPRVSYQANEAYAVEVTVPRDGFLYCYLLGNQGSPSLFFPNPARRSAAVSAAAPMQFPGPFAFKLRAPAQAGQESVACLHTAKDLGSDPLKGDMHAKDLGALKLWFEKLAMGPVDAAGWDVAVH
jgi:type III secretion protein C